MIFDKTLRKKKRAYSKGELLTIECCNMSNPKEFWKHIKKLGPKKKGSILWEVTVDNVVHTEKNVVLQKWLNDFQSLYEEDTGGETETFDNYFRDEILSEIQQIETSTVDQCPVRPLNGMITHKEVSDAIKECKKNKACGIDLITNELLKCEEVTDLLHVFFVKCQKSRLIPEI